MPIPASEPSQAEIMALVEGRHASPHAILGAHRDSSCGANGVSPRLSIRAWMPGARAMAIIIDGCRTEMERLHDAGLFGAHLRDREIPEYRLEVTCADGSTFTTEDPYRFPPTLREPDLHLLAEGRHYQLWQHLGAHVRVHQGVPGTAFSVWAPNARGVRVVGDFNTWDSRHPMRVLGSSGVWEIFVPGVGSGTLYKYEVMDADGRLAFRADPFAFATEAPPGSASITVTADYKWHDEAWISDRDSASRLAAPASFYECHLGSWRFREEPDGSWRPLSYRELAEELPRYVLGLGFTHVALMPVAEHPSLASWGYQVTGYYAPTARYGSPDDFRFLVDSLHRKGIGVIVDWVGSHFARDAWALARFDGTALYEHADPRRSCRPDWDTIAFNYGRFEVRNFLIANALFWLREYHVDGLRFDALASILYLPFADPNGNVVVGYPGHGEDADAIDFVRELNEIVHSRHSSALIMAEEWSTWPGVSRSVATGGLGFDFKWNMGWTHDTLTYFGRDPVHRRWHHEELTFGLTYAFCENFILPISHDDVVHGKSSLLAKMPGDRWQQFANLRALLAWMWAYPGRPLLFMGNEFGQEDEWQCARSLDWHLLRESAHAGVQALVRTLNELYRDQPALWERDFDCTGFRWIEPSDAESSIFAFLRVAFKGARYLTCIANLTTVVRHGYRVGLPIGGPWTVVLDTDAPQYGGTGGIASSGVRAAAQPWHGLPYSACLTLPPLAVLWLIPAAAAQSLDNEPGGESLPRL
ncbi:MAG TPA: 1,4-alpha-glucan branching protein GlgB [Streptosporangiaceae bacterium]